MRATPFLLVLALACRSDKPGGDDTSGGDTDVAEVDQDGDGFNEDQDCDDDNAAVNPDAEELCDGIDNNCDDAVDEGVAGTFYADGDGDGYGDAAAPQVACDPPDGTVEDGTDCDDTDDGVHPGAPEACDGQDDDCDGEVDEDVLDVWYADADDDGYGDPDASIEDCDPGDGYVGDATDCDDAHAEAHPGADEVCDGLLDEDCDGTVDEDDAIDASTWYQDVDGDGYGDADTARLACDAPSSHVDNAEDCDDGEFDVSPDGTEVCNGVDDNCDGTVDEDTATDALTWYADSDGDGYGDASSTTLACAEPSGYLADATDCDDTRADVHPLADEYCDGTVDEDCDGTVDEDDAVDAATWYADVDTDGYGASTSGSATQCVSPSGYVSTDDDCDDAAASVNPAATEVCDSVDNNCDGTVDEDSAADALTWYADTDGDGYGDASSTTAACEEPSGYTDDTTDCDDTDGTSYPGSTATETPFDGIDQDCDGLDECTDLDCDGLPDIVVPTHYAGAYAADSYIYTNASGFDDTSRVALATAGVYDADAGDLDGDGYQDVVFASYYSGSSHATTSSVYWGSGAGHSTADVTGLDTLGAVDVLVTDLDADGYDELVFSNYYSGSSRAIDSYVYWGSSAGYSTADRTDLATLGAFRAAADDLDGDGYQDLVFCNHYSGGYGVDSYVYWGSAAGYSDADRSDLPTQGCRDVELDDLNGDGWGDIVFANQRTSGSFYASSMVYWGSASGFSTSYRETLTTYGTLSVETGDFNQDGYTDLAFGGYYVGSWTTEAYTMVYWNSALGFSSSVYTALPTRGAREIEASDLNADGYTDLVIPRYYSGASYGANSYVMWGSTTGLSTTDRTDLPTTGAGHVAMGDLDGNGVPELLFSNYYTGTSWASYADDRVYFGEARTGLYDSADRIDLDTYGTWPSMVVVGDADW
jgi:hypothetical protein